MEFKNCLSKLKPITSSSRRAASGFTLIEVLVAGMLLIILCVGVLTVFEQAIKLNRGNKIRAQALSVLQKKVELYRAMKYAPVNPDPLLAGRTETVTDTGIASADGTLFDVTGTIDNDPFTPDIQTGNAGSVPVVTEANCKFKEITIKATPHDAQAGWITAIATKVTFQRVRLVN
jgi:type II secretory pathway pseudopilin PulG